MVTATSPWALCDGGGILPAPVWATAELASKAESRIVIRIGASPLMIPASVVQRRWPVHEQTSSPPHSSWPGKRKTAVPKNRRFHILKCRLAPPEQTSGGWCDIVILARAAGT